MLGAWLLGFGTASARPLALHPSPGADVVVLPRTSPDRIEVGVYHNTAPIGLEVREWRADGLDFARVTNLGGGTAIVVVALDDPGLVLVPTADEDHPDGVAFALLRGEVALAEPAYVPTVDELFAGVPRRVVDPPRELALVPLLREARTFALPPEEVRLPVSVADVGPAGPLGSIDAPTWKDVDRWRQGLPELDGAQRSIAYTRLGEAHRALGMPREAAYYFGRASAEGFPPASVFLARADAALEVGAYDTARAACREAWARDGDAEAVLTCLGVLALATDAPSPAATGRALGAIAVRPEGKQLAGELLLRDGYAEEAVPLLAEAAQGLPVGPGERAWAALGDAHLALGDTEGARVAYLSTPHHLLEDELEVREIAIRMLVDGVRRWPAWVPALTLAADRGGPASADALYLLAQVHARFLDDEAAATDLARLWDHGSVRQGTDVGPRLLDACTRRAQALEDGQRHAEIAALYEICWREGLAAHVSDTRLFTLTAHAYEVLGLPDEALEVQIALTTILAGGTVEDPLQLGHLAHLQAVTGRPERALETVAYARKLAPDVAIGRRLDLVEAEAHTALEDYPAALRALERASRDPQIGVIAQEREAVVALRLGRCAQAAPALARRLATGPITEAAPGDLELGLVRCQVALGRPKEALIAATWAVTRATDDWTRDEARWLATAIGDRTGLAVPNELVSADATWAAIRKEDAQHAAFLDALATWSQGDR